MQLKFTVKYVFIFSILSDSFRKWFKHYTKEFVMDLSFLRTNRQILTFVSIYKIPNGDIQVEYFNCAAIKIS